jgi:hypothetical protein
VIVLVVVALALPAAAGGRPLGAALTGAAEVNGGDPDGSGQALVTLNQGQREVCFEIQVSNIETPTRAHIHRGVAGENGPIVVAFFDFVVPDGLTGCVEADKSLIKDIRNNPADYYVNVHNAAFPGGAVRGQLEK